jgi:hypothetical protein
MDSTKKKKEVLVGEMDVAGYVWHVTAATEDGIRAAMLAEWKRRVREGAIFDMTDGPDDDPLEYHGLVIHRLVPGKVEWL